jgi:hypothetical protein
MAMRRVLIQTAQGRRLPDGREAIVEAAARPGAVALAQPKTRPHHRTIARPRPVPIKGFPAKSINPDQKLMGDGKKIIAIGGLDLIGDGSDHDLIIEGKANANLVAFKFLQDLYASAQDIGGVANVRERRSDLVEPFEQETKVILSLAGSRVANSESLANIIAAVAHLRRRRRRSAPELKQHNQQLHFAASALPGGGRRRLMTTGTRTSQPATCLRWRFQGRSPRTTWQRRDGCCCRRT